MTSTGSMVSNAVHRRAGPELMLQCRQLEACSHTGQTRITPGFELPARNVMHVCGPVTWNETNPIQGLYFAYQNVIITAINNNFKTISTPSLGTGSGGFSCQYACRDAVRSIVMLFYGYVVKFPLSENSEDEEVLLPCSIPDCVERIDAFNLVCYNKNPREFQDPYPEFMRAMRDFARGTIMDRDLNSESDDE